MSKTRVPSYRWRFSLAMIVCVTLFGWLAWESLEDDSFSFGLRMRGTLVFAALASISAWLEWRHLHSQR